MFKTPKSNQIDYRGYRLVGLSILPITADTLRYGSSDGGKNIMASDEELNICMTRAAQKLNIKAHMAGVHASRKILHGPADIEGHKGLDDRYYVLDFARYLLQIPP